MARAQSADEPGRSIGKVSTDGKLIFVEMNAGALGKANLFDLKGRTLRFIPAGSRYRVRNVPLRWDRDYGPEFRGSEASLHRFAFPFASHSWSSVLVGTSGSLRFGGSEKKVGLDPYGHPEAGIALDRFDQLGKIAAKLNERGPAIAVFLKPRLQGRRFLKELADRVVITWNLTEPYGSFLDFSWFKTVNRFQAVLHRNGTIELSYREVAAKDAIVGLYPTLSTREKATRVDFSLNSRGSFSAPYEAFHYLAAPKPQDLSCTVIKALGDRFDLLAYYSDFRIDSQEASPPSDGPVGGNVRGIGDSMHDQSASVLASRCTGGRFQQGYMGPVYAGANEAQEAPPPEAPADTERTIAYYSHQIRAAAAAYNYAVGHLGHEFGHRWGAYVTAKVNGHTLRLGPWPHWAAGLQAPVAFPYSLPAEASTLGGALWQANGDGTYTQLRGGYFVPAAGYSYLDLYLMGLMPAEEVPDFFLLQNLEHIKDNSKGRHVFKADREKVSVEDVIAAEGPRSPDFDHSQRRFNAGIVVMVEPGRRPSAKLLREAAGIRRQWIRYWETVTGGRSSMTADPR